MHVLNILQTVFQHIEDCIVKCEHRCHVSYLIFESDTCKYLLTQKDKVEYDKNW